MKRLFLALKLEINNEFKEKYHSLKSSLAGENISWAKEDNLHLTLKFFGSTPSSKVKDIEIACQKALEDEKAFNLKADQMGIFGSNYKPRVLWLGFSNAEILKNIHKNIEEELKSINYYPDRQNFVPHLTLGRIKKLNSKKYFQTVIDKKRDWSEFDFRIEKISLFESKLHRNGPEHISLIDFNLQ